MDILLGIVPRIDDHLSDGVSWEPVTFSIETGLHVSSS